MEDRLGLGSSFDLVDFLGAGVSVFEASSSVDFFDFDLRPADGSDACAFARAPNETDERSIFGVSCSGFSIISTVFRGGT